VNTTWRVLVGDVRDKLAELPAGSVQCCVTSPPYWGGVRDYGHDAQIGLERQPSEYVAQLVTAFDGVRRVLADDGVLWLNVGDVYAASGKGGGGNRSDRACWATVVERKGFRGAPKGYKQKDLTLVAFALADALRRDGWYLRATVIWRKPAAVEPMRVDRVAVSHEYLFHLSKREYYLTSNPGEAWWGHSVWDITPEGHPGFTAAMPEELARRCIVSSSAEGQTVLDPFAGSGTVGAVAVRMGREFVGVELNPDTAQISRRRIGNALPMFSQEVPA
jgi:site-specific DNA-methyltransferase (cytosine-N4-specific)